jgi:hypothetical protein
MLKMFLATVVAGAFLISAPVRAEDKSPPAGEKAEKGKKDKEKDEKSAPKKGEKGEKAGGW